MQIESFRGKAPVLIAVFYPVEDIRGQQLQLFGGSSHLTDDFLLQLFRQAMFFFDEVLPRQVQKSQWGHQVMADNGDKPGLDLVSSFQLLVLGLQFPGFFGDLPFQLVLPDLQPEGPPTHDPTNKRDQYTKAEHPAPGALPPVRNNVKIADRPAVVIPKAIGLAYLQPVISGRQIAEMQSGIILNVQQLPAPGIRLQLIFDVEVFPGYPCREP